MKTVILAGGLGTRISEESYLKPKPMIEIGEQPILWRIMKYYSSFGFNDFIICCGYKGHIIKEYFADYYLYRSDVTFDFSDVTFDFSDENRMTVHQNVAEPWRVAFGILPRQAGIYDRPHGIQGFLAVRHPDHGGRPGNGLCPPTRQTKPLRTA